MKWKFIWFVSQNEQFRLLFRILVSSTSHYTCSVSLVSLFVWITTTRIWFPCKRIVSKDLVCLNIERTSWQIGLEKCEMLRCSWIGGTISELGCEESTLLYRNNFRKIVKKRKFLWAFREYFRGVFTAIFRVHFKNRARKDKLQSFLRRK